jgi:NarL family two-component system sensor histidine kinase LiaS
LKLLSRLLGWFRWRLSLGWKLTLSYTLVTVAALLAVGLVFLLFAVGISRLPPTTQLQAEGLYDFTAPRLQRHLVRTPDPEGVRGVLLEEVYWPGAGEEEVSSPDFEPGELPGEITAVVVDPERRVLGYVPDVRGYPPRGEHLDTRSFPGLEPLLRAALAGEDDPNRLHARSSDGGGYAVAPVKNDRGRVVGVVFKTMPPPAPLLDFALLLLPSVLFFLGVTVVVGVMGAVFGFVTARGFTRRLRGLARASEAWSRGDFSATSEDRSGDEIGQLNKALNRMAGQLEGLIRTRQELATVEARNRFARDLHDSVKQQVFATSLHVDTARALIEHDKGADFHLVRANELLEGAQRELNTLIHEMRPAMLEGRRLGEALRDYAAGWSRGCEIPSEVRVHGERQAPLEVEQALFRVAQESLANVAKHSGAGRVGIRLLHDADAVTLRVTDDGRGFDPARTDGKGFGLRSMRERMCGLGGKLEIESAPGKGTRITGVCPLAGAPPEGAGER